MNYYISYKYLIHYVIVNICIGVGTGGMGGGLAPPTHTIFFTKYM